MLYDVTDGGALVHVYNFARVVLSCTHSGAHCGARSLAKLYALIVFIVRD